MIIGTFHVSASVVDGVPYLQALNLDTPHARALAAKIDKAAEAAHEEQYKTEQSGKPKTEASEQQTSEGGSRKRWTLEEKIECAKYAIEHGNQAAADKFGVSKGMAATLKSHYSTGKLK